MDPIRGVNVTSGLEKTDNITNPKHALSANVIQIADGMQILMAWAWCVLTVGTRKGNKMKYHVITAVVNGSLKTGLVSGDEWVECPEAGDYFPYGASEVCYCGIVDIEGDAECSLPGYLIEG